MNLSNQQKELLLCALDFIFDRVPRRRPPIAKLREAKVVAHRGAHSGRDVYENTLKAFSRAIELGVFGIEFDVRWSKDLEPVIHHDADLWRHYGISILLSDLSLAELRARFPDIPTLAEVLKLCAGRAHLFIELKHPTDGWSEAQRLRLAHELAHLKPQIDYHLMYIKDETRTSFAEVAPATWLPVAEFDVAELSQQSMALGLAGITSHYCLMTRSIIAAHRARNNWVGTGFIDSKANLYREVGRSVNLIFTNHSAQIMSWLRAAMQLMFIVTVGLSAARAVAQDAAPPAPGPSKRSTGSASGPAKTYSSEYSLFVGPFLPSNIGGVTEILHVVGGRIGLYTKMGTLEPEFFSAHGDGVTYNSASLDYRVDVSSQFVAAHFLMGMHLDHYAPPDTGYKMSGGWHYGGGLLLPLSGPIWLRTDFKYRFSPGTSLFVGVGVTVRFDGTGGAKP